MIVGLCESSLTFRAIIIWRDELNEGKVFLRDIIDLEATYAGPDAKAMPAPVIGSDGQPTWRRPTRPRQRPVQGSARARQWRGCARRRRFRRRRYGELAVAKGLCRLLTMEGTFARGRTADRQRGARRTSVVLGRGGRQSRVTDCLRGGLLRAIRARVKDDFY